MTVPPCIGPALGKWELINISFSIRKEVSKNVKFKVSLKISNVMTPAGCGNAKHTASVEDDIVART